MKSIKASSFAIALLFVACNQVTPKTKTGVEQTASNVNKESTCPDDGPRLAETGICAGRAVHYMNIVDGDAPGLPQNCTWEVNETAFAGGDYLLYLAATCDGKKAKLEFSGGANFADLNLVWSAVANRSLADSVLIKVTGADMAKPYDNILAHAKKAMENKPEAAKCSVRPATIDGWPEDALVVDAEVVDFSAVEAAKALTDMPRSACGAFGIDEDNASYWRVFQGFSWWFQFSQDSYQDIDPRTLTLISSDGVGGWAMIEK